MLKINIVEKILSKEENDELVKQYFENINTNNLKKYEQDMKDKQDKLDTLEYNFKLFEIIQTQLNANNDGIYIEKTDIPNKQNDTWTQSYIVLYDTTIIFTLTFIADQRGTFAKYFDYNDNGDVIQIITENLNNQIEYFKFINTLQFNSHILMHNFDYLSNYVQIYQNSDLRQIKFKKNGIRYKITSSLNKKIHLYKSHKSYNDYSFAETYDDIEQMTDSVFDTNNNCCCCCC